MYRDCAECANQRQRPAPKLFRSGSGSSPGRIEAATEALRIERELQEKEQRRASEPEYKFDYEPNYLPWCQWYTPTDDEVRNIEDLLKTGTKPSAVRAKARSADLDFVLDAARGEIRPVLPFAPVGTLQELVRASTWDRPASRLVTAPPDDGDVPRVPGAAPRGKTAKRAGKHRTKTTPTASPGPAGTRSFSKIEVEGRIHLGRRHELTQVPRESEDDLFMVRGPGSAREFDSAPTADTNSIGELLEFKFSEDSVDDL